MLLLTVLDGETLLTALVKDMSNNRFQVQFLSLVWCSCCRVDSVLCG